MMNTSVFPLKFVGTTDGRGYWSSLKKSVPHSASILRTFPDDDSFGELRVTFSPDDWDIDRHGLIYTDAAWLRDLRSALADAGLTEAARKDVEYSEQGMQGRNYVSLDVGGAFIAEARAKLGTMR